MSDLLKLMALDGEDLQVLSAHIQDAILRSDGITYLAGENRLIFELRRYAWEIPGARRWLFPKKERRLAALHFDKVTNISSLGIQQKASDEIYSLLAMKFVPDNELGSPSGDIYFSFSDGKKMIANVECIEAQLTDLGAKWRADSRPRHNKADKQNGGESG